MGASVMESVCPRCASPRDQREGPYFVCADCHWCWTVSITGTVYVESDWPPPPWGSAGDAGGSSGAAPRSSGAAQSDAERGRRLLGSVDGLADKLASPWPTPHDRISDDHLFAAEQITRLERTRAATAADYFNEGLPLAQLQAEGVWLPPLEADPPDASA